MKQSLFYVGNLCCPTEEGLIRNRLQSVDGIDRLEFNIMDRLLTVTHRLEDERVIFAALQALGMEPQVRTAAPATGKGETHGPAVPHPSRWLMAASGLLAASAELLALVTHAERSPLVIGLAVLSILLGGRDTLRKGWVALQNRTVNINLLMTLAVMGAVCIGEWPEAAMVTFLFGLAEMIEALSLDRARNAVRSLMALTPEKALVRDNNGAWREMPAAEVKIGQVVRVRPGERIPLDGTLTTGTSFVNQAPITGESVPVEKQTDDPVFAGTVNERGSFEFQVTADYGHTTLARIVRSIQEAQSERAPTQRFVDRFAHYYTPTVVLLALLVAALPPLLFAQPFSPWLYRALVLLVIACPCALVISTPVTVVSGLAAAARHGILIKGGAYLEAGRTLQVIALDKTGTLTTGTPVVTDVILLNGMTEERVLQLAASLETHSEHPVAFAIVAKWTGKATAPKEDAGLIRLETMGRARVLLPVTDFEAVVGRGVQGRVGGELYLLGSHRLAEEQGLGNPRLKEELERLEQSGKTTVVLSSEREALAVFGVADTLRETSLVAVRELHDLGLKAVMLTGDNQTTAETIAAQVGIDDVRGNLLPDDKLKAVGELLGQGCRVGMVGDGINDAPALARATIGFAMGAAGTDTVLETADVALMQDDLQKLPQFLRLSREAGSILAQNIGFAVAVKVVFFTLAVTGMATLWMAVFADMGASLLVVFNGLRLLRYGMNASPVQPAVEVPCGVCCGAADGTGNLPSQLGR